MTTSVLTTHIPGSLLEKDLQVLRDYALDAPYEWRMAFDELIEMAEHWFSTADELERIEKFKAAVKNVNLDVLKFVDTIETKSAENKLTKGDVRVLCTAIRGAMKTLTDAVEEKES